MTRLEALARNSDALGLQFREVSEEYLWRTPERGNLNLQTILKSDEEFCRADLRARLYSALSDFNPDVISVPGWNSWFSLNALCWADNNQVPAVVMSDSQEIDFRRYWWKEKIKSWILAFSNAALVAGTAHIQYLLKLGYQREKIYVGYDVVDNAFFEKEAYRIRRQPEHWRREFSLPTRYLLCVARFVEKKNIGSLLNAYRLYLDAVRSGRCKGEPLSLVLLGEGPMRDELETRSARLGLKRFVQFAGFRPVSEIPVFYALADALVLASITEQWGLVVNEAMASGLPVLVSDRCGCAPDLVINGENGYCFDPTDVPALAERMIEVATGRCDLEAMGQRSRQIIGNWTPMTFAKGLADAADAAQAVPRPSSRFWQRALLRALARR